MESIQALIEERIDGLVRDVMVMVRASATEAMGDAMRARNGGKTSPRTQPPAKSARRTQAPKPRRTAEQLAEMAERLDRQIDATPGETMSVYAEQLGVTAMDMTVPARRLKKAGRIRKVGERSETRYFPMGPVVTPKTVMVV